MDSPLEEDTLIILGDSGVASPPVPPLSARATPFPDSGVDLQGLQWNLSEITRDQYRLRRMRDMVLLQRRNEVPVYIGEDLQMRQEEQPPILLATHMNRIYPCTTHHPQLRHLLWSPTATAVNFTYGPFLMEWDPVASTDTPLLNFRDYCGAHARISTICTTPDLLLMGGFYGELVCGRRYAEATADQPPAAMKRITANENGITNHITPFHETFPARFLISSNDAQVRLFDAEAGSIVPLVARDAPINAAGLSPCGRSLCLGTDATSVEIVDIRSQQTALQLTGHVGFTFSCSWHPAGHILATGNEDHTARIYDLRRPERSLHVLGARMAPVRSVRFSPSGDCLAVAEMADFVTFYNCGAAFARSTTLDFFGQCTGVDFAPDGQGAFVGCSDDQTGGVIEMRRPAQGWLSSVDKYFL